MIPVNRAVYAFDYETGRAGMSSWPMRETDFKGWSTVGAVFMAYQKWPKKDQQMNLLVEVIQSIVRDGIDPKEAFNALMKVEGMSELFAQDCQTA